FPLPLFETGNFRLAQMTELACREAVISEERNSHTLQLYHWKANALKHAAYLVVAPLDERDLVPGPVPPRNRPDLARRRRAAVEGDALLKSRQLLRRRTSFQLDLVGSGYGRSAGHQEICQFP